jgi:hypothetical protein
MCLAGSGHARVPMSEFTITIQALPPHTTAALRSMLGLLEPAVGARWRVTDAMPADVVLLPAEAFAQIDARRAAEELPLLLALSAEERRPAQAYGLLKKPVTPARVVEALNLAEGLIERARGSAEGPHTVPLLESVDTQRKLAPGTLDTRVRTALRAATFRLLQAPVAATLIDEARSALFSILPGLGYCTRLTPAEFVPLFRANPPAILVELSPPEQAALSGARDFRPLRELEWTFWITSRSPWLRTELRPDGNYRLKRWPDFGRLAHYQADIRLASILISQPMSLGALRERTGLPAETVMNFLNAAFALGALADADTATTPARAPRAPAPAARGFGAVIAQLRRRFGLAGAAG